ncbi:hypothetical protein ACFE04_011495 [Oxalis oulophora]
MALIPSRHFYYPTTTKTTTLLHSFQSKLLNKNRPFHLKHLTFNAFSSKSKNPSKNSNFHSWLHSWNIPHHQIRPKTTPLFALSYRNDSDSDSDSDSVNDSVDVRDDDDDGVSSSRMDKIVEKLKKFGYVKYDKEEIEVKEKSQKVIEKGSVEEILYVEEGLLPNTRGGFSKESPFGIGDRNMDDVKFPWERRKKVERVVVEGLKRESRSRTSLAELTLPESELRRLVNLAFREKSKTKVKGGGVTQAVVDAIHEKWKTSEIVRIKVEGPGALNMKRMHEILEKKTGGLVIWRSGTSISLYRGVSYEVPEQQYYNLRYRRDEISLRSLPATTDKTIRDPSKLDSDNKANTPLTNHLTTFDTEDNRDSGQTGEVKYEDEIDELLDSLGPRYTEWSGCEPLPVDADLLPGFVLGYQPPFRILPYGVEAGSIKRLTGGILLSRNKDFLVFYRGKDFLSPDVSEALMERERLAKSLQDKEEQARLGASAFIMPHVDTPEQAGTAGSLWESLNADARWGKKLDDSHKEKVAKEAKVVNHASLVRKLERKLVFAERRLMRAETALAKVEVHLKPAEIRTDPESITDEERFMFRKLGLRMHAFLLLGRRGVFDGTVENMHLHWKYRELVKILVKAKTFEPVKKIALALEAESGGILVSVDRVSKGYAIIVYRGKDYRRPPMLRPKNLLTKRKALTRSIELQRQEALVKHISNLQANIDNLRAEIELMDVVKDGGDEELYNRLDSTYSSDDDSEEEEGDEQFLEPYDNESDDETESFKSEFNSGFPTTDKQTEDEGDESILETYNRR